MEDLPNYGFRYVAYDAANGEYEEFKTLKEAEDWLTDGDGEGISEEACNGQNWIAEIQYVSEVTKIDDKSNYHENEDGELVNDDGEEWPLSDDFDWLGDHHYVKIDWDDEEKKEAESNAHLIAASPELLKSLQRLTKICSQEAITDRDSFYKEFDEAVAEAKKTINKALGEEQE